MIAEGTEIAMIASVATDSPGAVNKITRKLTNSITVLTALNVSDKMVRGLFPASRLAFSILS